MRPRREGSRTAGVISSGSDHPGYQTFTFGVGSGTGIFTGTLADSPGHAGHYEKIGGGAQILAGSSTFTGGMTISDGTLGLYGEGNPNDRVFDTTIKAGGTLRLLSDNQIGTSTVTVQGGILDFDTNIDSFASLEISNGGLVTGTGTGAFTLETTGTPLLSATGGGNAGTISANIGITSQYGVGGDRDRSMEMRVAPATVLTISGILRDTLEGAAYVGGIQQTGGGTLRLLGSNTYTGATTITAGTLMVNGSTATGAVTVSSIGTLGGSGIIGGDTTVGGVHAPGDGIGNQTFSSNLSYTNGSSFMWQLGSQTTSATFDTVDVAGALNISGGNIFYVLVSGLNLSDSFWSTTRTWDIFDAGAGTSGNFSRFYLFDANNLFILQDYSNYGRFSFIPSTGSLQWSAIPEPTNALAGLLIAAGLLRRRRP